MTRYKHINLLFIALTIAILTGCSGGDQYNKLIREQLATGVQKDSLFLGFKLGMTKKQFYTTAWELNKKHVVTNGGRNLSVEYHFDDLKKPAVMNFYPTFYNDKIYQMPVVVKYESWAPWNRNLFADSLQQDVLKLFKKWYGKDFITIHDKKKGLVYIKVDGNRSISIFQENDMYVDVLFSDLRVEQKLKAKRHPWAAFWDKIEALF